jgi:hypothetical protein
MLTVALCMGLQAGPILTLDPAGGALSGFPGQTVGWGYTLVNDTDYLVVTSADYVTATPVGAFTDFISGFNFIVVGPPPESTVVSQSFDLLAQTGIGSYLIDPAAPIGASSIGVIQLTYDLYSVSPNDPAFDPGTDLVSGGNFLEADASVEVVIPEPSTYLLLACGLIALAVVRRQACRPGRG